jgi:hypothetical protein
MRIVAVGLATVVPLGAPTTTGDGRGLRPGLGGTAPARPHLRLIATPLAVPTVAVVLARRVGMPATGRQLTERVAMAADRGESTRVAAAGGRRKLTRIAMPASRGELTRTAVAAGGGKLTRVAMPANRRDRTRTAVPTRCGELTRVAMPAGRRELARVAAAAGRRELTRAAVPAS